MSRGAKGAVEAAGRAHGGNGRVPGLCCHSGSPQAGSVIPDSAPWGSPLPGPGGSRRRLCHSHQPFTARGGLATKQLQGVPGLGPAVFCPCLEGAGAMSGVWSSTWKMKIMKGDTHMESPSCRNTPGEGGEMDGEGKQDQNDSVCK